MGVWLLSSLRGSRTDRLLQLHWGTLTPRRTLQPPANLCRIKLQLGNGAAERVAVHAQLAGRLALVAPVPRQHLQNEALLELTHPFGIGDAARLHVCYQTIQLSLQKKPLSGRCCPGLFLFPGSMPGYSIDHPAIAPPVRLSA